MRTRTFAFCFLAFLALLLGSTMAANVIIDPEAVFDPGRAEMRVNSNSRYLRYLEYREKGRDAEALLFGSSRGNIFERDVVAQRLGVAKVQNFSVTYGMITDHLPTLEYVIREKASRGEKLKSVVLMLDIAHFGKPPWTNINLDGFLAPEVSGEHPARFWWRYVTAFQFRAWRATIRKEVGRRVAEAPERPLRSLGAPALAGMLPAWRPPQLPLAQPAAAETKQVQRRYDVVLRPMVHAHLKLLARFVEVCRQNGVALTVMTSPLSRANASMYDAEEPRRVAHRISEIVPLWDFGIPAVLDRGEFWLDYSHFTPGVARILLDRVTGQPGAPPEELGVLRGRP
jgi:hypothetical protein